MRQGTKRSSFLFVANLLCLDLVNTEVVEHGERKDLLGDVADLVAWLREGGLLQGATAGAVTTRWSGTKTGRAVFAQALALRSALEAIAARLVEGKRVGEGALRTINRVLATRPRYPQLVRHDRRIVLRSRNAPAEAIHLLVPIAESAAWLLTEGERTRVRRCDGPTCILYFYDTSKNRRRRWCSMESCGGRAKAAAYYWRRRTEPDAEV